MSKEIEGTRTSADAAKDNRIKCEFEGETYLINPKAESRVLRMLEKGEQFGALELMLGAEQAEKWYDANPDGDQVWPMFEAIGKARKAGNS